MLVVHNPCRLFVKMSFFYKIREKYILDIMQNHDIIDVLRQNESMEAAEPRVAASERKRCMDMNEFPPIHEQDCPRASDPALRDLLLQAQAGSREAYLALCAKYRPLLESSVARFAPSFVTKQESEDMREEAERVFLCAVSSFDTEQDAVDFGLYAKICLRNGLVSEWRHIQTRRRVTALPLDEAVEIEAGAEREDLSARMVEDESFRQLCRTVRGHLSDFENRVWWPFVTGVSVSEIARELGRDERSVHNAIYRIRRKLRERLSE